MDIDKQIQKLEGAIVAPYERLGITPEQYITDLTIRWQSINALMKSGSGDFSIVKSTITDTLEFIAWAQSKRELTSAVALIKSYMTRLKAHNDYKSITEGSNERT